MILKMRFCNDFFVSKKLINIVFGIVAMASYAQEPSYPPNEDGWKLVFKDDFDGDKLDTSIWKYEHGSSNSQLNCYRDSNNVVVTNGNLRIYMTGNYEESREDFIWKCGYIYSKQQFHGNMYFEARMKAQRFSGINNAFWLVSRDASATNYNDRYEIDIHETKYDTSRQKFASHVAWHDWKSYNYTVDRDGLKADIALGYMTYYDSDDYQIWGLWIDDNQNFHYYLNGKHVWDGKYHKSYPNQWFTGVGNIPVWYKNEEQRAYGKYGQKDWSYRGGYTGDLMQVAFSNMLLPSSDSPEDEKGAGSYMSVDWVRVYAPLKNTELDELHVFDWKNDVPVINGTCEQEEHRIKIENGSVRWKLPWNIDFAVASNYYLYYDVYNPQNVNYQIKYLNKDGKIIASQKVLCNSKDRNICFGGNVASTLSVYPYTFYNVNDKDDVEESKYIHRFVTNIDDGDTDAFSIAVFDAKDIIPVNEPYFYNNVDEHGNTSFNNDWSLNLKGTENDNVSYIEIENLTGVAMFVNTIKMSSNYYGLVYENKSVPFASVDGVSLINGRDSVCVYVESLAEKCSLCYELDGIAETVEVAPGNNVLFFDGLDKTTLFSLKSISDGSMEGEVSGEHIFVKEEDCIKYNSSYDTYIQSNTPDTDYSNQAKIVLKSDQAYAREGYIEFDLSDIDYCVDNSYLFLNMLESDVDFSGAEVSVYIIDGNISKPLLWNNAPGWINDRFLCSFDVSDGMPRKYGICIGNIINDFIVNGRKSISLKISISGGSKENMIYFASCENKKLSPYILLEGENKIQSGQSVEILPVYDTFISQQGLGMEAGSGSRQDLLWVKDANSGWGRKAFIKFQVPEGDYNRYVLSARLENMQDAGNFTFVKVSSTVSDIDLTGLTWDSNLSNFNWMNCGWLPVESDDIGSYLDFDVTESVLNAKQNGHKSIIFMLEVGGGDMNALLKFNQGHDNQGAANYPPKLKCFEYNIDTGISINNKINYSLYPTIVDECFFVEGNEFEQIYIISSVGDLVKIWNSFANNFDVSDLQCGIYFVIIKNNDNNSECFKIIKK